MNTKPIKLECESCPNIGIEYAPYKIIDDINMCTACQVRDAEIKLEVHANEVNHPSQKNVNPVDLINNLHEVVKQGVPFELKTSQDFFNAETIAYVDVQKQIDADDSIPQDEKRFAYHNYIKTQHELFRKRLFELKKEELELSNRDKALQYILNSITHKFKTEERDALKLQDINYVPKVVAVKAPKVKLSPEDKLIDTYAKFLKVDFETAKKLFAHGMREQKITSSPIDVSDVVNDESINDDSTTEQNKEQ